MTTIASPPDAELGPECVQDALDSVGVHGDGRLLALNSYENRVYQAWRDDKPPVVVKFYRPLRWTDEQILEEHVFIDELARAEVPAVAPLRLEGDTLHRYAGFRFAVFPRRGGRAPELDRRDTLEQLGRYIARIHTVGAAKPFAHRPPITVATFGDESRAYLLEHGFVPDDLVAAWSTIADLALDATRRIVDRVDVAAIRLHGDCHAGNVLWTDAGPHFVDLDDARTGPAVQDLWMLANDERAMDAVLEGYRQFRDFDDSELALIPALRAMRQLHYAGWIAARWHDPAFPAAFPFVAESRWWDQHVADLHELADELGAPS